MIISYVIFDEKQKKIKKGVDEEKSFVLYYNSRADESRKELQRTLKPYAAQDVP